MNPKDETIAASLLLRCWKVLHGKPDPGVVEETKFQIRAFFEPRYGSISPPRGHLPPHPLPASPAPEGYTLNRDKSVAVATDYYTSPEMNNCPRGAKVILIGKGGVATISIYDGDPFWIEWAPLPKRRAG